MRRAKERKRGNTLIQESAELEMSAQPKYWQANTRCKLGDCRAIRIGATLFVLRCVREGQSGSKTPAIHNMKQNIKVPDGECDWMVERLMGAPAGQKNGR